MSILQNKKRDVKLGISICSRIIRLMNNQPNSQKKASIHQKEEKATTRMLWLLWNLYHNWVASRRTRMRRFLKEENSPGETRCKKSWINSKSTVHPVYATSSKYPGKERTIACKNTSQTSSSAKSQRYEIWRQTSRRDRKTTAMHPWQSMESCPKYIQVQKQGQDYVLLARRKWVLPAASTKEPKEREFVVDSGASMHMVSKKTWTLMSWRPWRHREESHNGSNSQRRGANQVRSYSFFCQRIGLSRDGYASWKYTGSSFTRETLRGSWVYQPLDQWSETTTRKKGKRIDCNISNYVPFVVSGLSTNSSTSSSPTSSTSSSQDPVFDICRYTENPATERSGSTIGELRRNPLHRPSETKNTNKNGGDEKVRAAGVQKTFGWWT